MKIKQLLESDSLSKYGISEKVLRDIKKDFSLFQTGSGYLFRGDSSAKPGKFEYRTIRTDRKPRDIKRFGMKTPNSGEEQPFDDFFNSGIEAAFGVKDIRRKSLFATSSDSLARTYGNGSSVSVIFPANECNVLYSKNVSDSGDLSISKFVVAEYMSLFDNSDDFDYKSIDIRKIEHEIYDNYNKNDDHPLLRSIEKTFGMKSSVDNLKQALRSYFLYDLDYQYESIRDLEIDDVTQPEYLIVGPDYWMYTASGYEWEDVIKELEDYEAI